jgi:hypothetical protein
MGFAWADGKATTADSAAHIATELARDASFRVFMNHLQAGNRPTLRRLPLRKVGKM